MSPFTRQAGFAYARSLLVLALLALFLLGIYSWTRGLNLSRSCETNLKKLYLALELYELEHKQLPTLAFYPNKPGLDRDSILPVLSHLADIKDACVCKAAHPFLRQTGLTYVWNVQLNGVELPKTGEAKWMLTDIQAISDSVDPPHQGHYHVLYTDGRVIRSIDPPPGIKVYAEEN